MKKIIYKFIAVVIAVMILFCSCDSNNSETTTEYFGKENKQICQEYITVLEDYALLVENLFSPSFENDINSGKFKSPNPNLEYEWFNMIVDSLNGLDEPNISSFGYALKDINSDGITELILLREDYFVLAVFTLDSDKVQLLDAYWYKHIGMILESGELLTLTTSSANIYEYNIQTLSAQSTELSVVKTFGENENGYYEVVDTEITILDEQSFNSVLSQYPNISSDERKSYMISNGLQFIAL